MNATLDFNSTRTRTMAILKSHATDFTTSAFIALLPALLAQLSYLIFTDFMQLRWGLFGGWIWGAFMWPMLAAMLTHTTLSAIQGGQRPDEQRQQAERAMTRRLPALAGTSLLAGSLLSLGGLMCLIPGFLGAMNLCVCGPAVLIEGCRPHQALARSAELTQDIQRALASLAAECFVGFIVLYVVHILLLSFDASWLTAGVLIVGHMLSCVILAWLSTLSVVLYHDLRQLREGSSVDDLLATFD